MDVDEGLKLEQVDDGPSEELGDANENATNSPNDEPSLRSPDDDGESPLEIGDVGIMPSPGGIHDPESNATDKANVDRPSENKTQTVDNVGSEDHVEAATPSPSTKPLCRTANDASGGGASNGVKKLKMTEDEEVETQEEQAEFMRELESFYKERSMEFKPPKFYGEPLNCLKLWKSVVQLGGYDWVTANKLWRQVGESFHPPKTCTTVSWTFRIFYEKALLEYEKHKRQIGELEFPGAPVVEPSSVETEASRHQNTGSGRARRDSAARAMQGWHDQGLIGEPIIKDKNLSSSTKREKHLKNLGVTKQRKPSNVDSTDNDMHVDTNKQLAATVVDIGPPADWVKINVRECKDCFEVYALVPGLLREEVRVQSDPAGRLVITGQPEQLDNPWGITPFKKVVNLPARINPLQTSAIVSLHGRLFVRVPFDRSNS